MKGMPPHLLPLSSCLTSPFLQLQRVPDLCLTTDGVFPCTLSGTVLSSLLFSSWVLCRGSSMGTASSLTDGAFYGWCLFLPGWCLCD